jgi:hypothetical protein
MLGNLTPGEEAQLRQTIEMFEVITKEQPLDNQSLEILKEAYLKLGRTKDVVVTSKRLASAYVQLGQLSSALLEYETILQSKPDDSEVLAAMAEISKTASPSPGDSSQAGSSPSAPPTSDTSFGKKKPLSPTALASVDDGRDSMQRIFVDGRLASGAEFAECWTASAATPHERVTEPFVQILSQRGGLPVDKSLQAICGHSRTPFINLDRYDVDIELAKTFPREVCRRLCVLPMDKMSKAVFIATANPFNKRAEEELRQFSPYRVVWYLAMPNDLHRLIEKIYR